MFCQHSGLGGGWGGDRQKGGGISFFGFGGVSGVSSGDASAAAAVGAARRTTTRLAPRGATARHTGAMRSANIEKATNPKP